MNGWTFSQNPRKWGKSHHHHHNLCSWLDLTLKHLSLSEKVQTWKQQRHGTADCCRLAQEVGIYNSASQPPRQRSSRLGNTSWSGCSLAGRTPAMIEWRMQPRFQIAAHLISKIKYKAKYTCRVTVNKYASGTLPCMYYVTLSFYRKNCH